MKQRWIPPGLLAGAGLCLFAVHAAMPAPARAAKSDALKPVAVVTARRHDLSRYVTFSAELRPFEEVDLHAKVAGFLKTIRVDIGDRVKQGQTIASIDIDELNDDLLHADAVFRDASLNYERIQDVVKGHPGLLAQEDVDKAETSFSMAKANRARAATMLGYATITAPFTGVITKRYVDPGALIQAGTASSSQAMPVVHIANDTTLRLGFPVPESVVAQVKVGTPVDVTVEATGYAVHSQVARMSGKVDTSTRTMEAEVDLDNREGRMTPGMYASAKVALEHKVNVVTLPIEAISAGTKPSVWVVNAQSALEERSVVIGMRTDDAVEIVSGLAEGENVVFGSRNALVLGSLVKPKQIAVSSANE